MPADLHPASPRHEPADALHALLSYLKAERYAFVTPTPATHRRVIARPGRQAARDLRDAFGWSRAFPPDLLPPPLLEALREAGLVEADGPLLRSSVRVSSLDGDLFLHSAFPPEAQDAVFFGPDTYRFARFLEGLADGRPIGLAIDVGVGGGPGAAVVWRNFSPRRLLATDISELALRLAAVSLAAAGVRAELRLADGLAGIAGGADLIVANPPFIADDDERTYRDGGDLHGAQVSIDWTLAGAQLLAPGGRFVLYTGSAIVEGRDRLRDTLVARLDPAAFDLDYREIDPDIFGEQLESEAYRDVERIAAIGAVVTRRGAA